jgi:hypothetical protein
MKGKSNKESKQKELSPTEVIERRKFMLKGTIYILLATLAIAIIVAPLLTVFG